jgi:hypothetical protein
MTTFYEALQTQRWDDHRYYHHNRINQSLHFISAVSFLLAYVYLFIDPPIAALIVWMVSMTTRQSGHFFFEPLGDDEVNQATQEYKEAVKVGFNLQRKIVLIAIWAAGPLLTTSRPLVVGALKKPHGTFTPPALRRGIIAGVWSWWSKPCRVRHAKGCVVLCFGMGLANWEPIALSTPVPI